MADVPEIFSGVIHLGPAEQTHRVGRIKAVFTVIEFAAFGGLVLLMLFFAAAAPFVGRDLETRIAGPIFLGGMGLIVGYIYVRQARREWRTLQTTAVRYERGFAVSIGGGPPAAFAWDDVTDLTAYILRQTIYGIIPAGRTYRFTIGCGAKGSVELNSPLQDVQGLFGAIRARTMPRIVSQLTARFRRGETVAFGPIAVSRDGGFSSAGRLLPWESILKIRVDGGMMVVTPKSGGVLQVLMYETGKIPNLDALLAVLLEAGVTLG